MKIFIPTIIKINGLYYLNISDLITFISLVCTKKYSTPACRTDGLRRVLTPKRKRLTSVERSKINIQIESPIHESIIGLLLGDGHIQKRSVLGNSRFIYAQSSLRLHHINYFKHVLELFKPYLSNDFNYKEKTFTDKRTNKEYKSVHFATLSLPCFNYYRDMFYDSNNLKIVPLNIKNLLTPRGLAYWIMDDGSLQNKGLHLNTYGFTHEGILKLKETFPSAKTCLEKIR